MFRGQICQISNTSNPFHHVVALYTIVCKCFTPFPIAAFVYPHFWDFQAIIVPVASRLQIGEVCVREVSLKDFEHEIWPSGWKFNYLNK